MVFRVYRDESTGKIHHTKGSPNLTAGAFTFAWAIKKKLYYVAITDMILRTIIAYNLPESLFVAYTLVMCAAYIFFIPFALELIYDNRYTFIGEYYSYYPLFDEESAMRHLSAHLSNHSSIVT